MKWKMKSVGTVLKRTPVIGMKHLDLITSSIKKVYQHSRSTQK